MRKLIVFNGMSLDGFYDGPGKDVMALAETLAPPFDACCAERLRAADTLLLGRTSFDGFRRSWPELARDPYATAYQREIAKRAKDVDKVVVSDTLTPALAAPWHNTRVVGRADAPERVAALKREPGAEILVFGSRTVWGELLECGLVDELHLMVGPVVIGGGTPLFDGPPPGSLRLAATRTWKGAGSVLLRYEVCPTPTWTAVTCHHPAPVESRAS